MFDETVDESYEGKTVVDRDAPIPLYHQIYLQLRDEILSGQRPYDSILPTERDMTELFGVSRITARRVLNELAQNNFVERKRRLGTRVVFKSPAKPIEGNQPSSGSLMALGHGTSVNVMEVSKEPPPPMIADTLKLAKDEMVVRAIRVRCLWMVCLWGMWSVMSQASFRTIGDIHQSGQATDPEDPRKCRVQGGPGGADDWCNAG